MNNREVLYQERTIPMNNNREGLYQARTNTSKPTYWQDKIYGKYLSSKDCLRRETQH